MADVCTSQSSQGSNFNDTCVIKNENKFVCCYKLQQELEITLQELSWARKIIQILQKDVNAHPDHRTVSTKEGNSNHDLNFETVNIKLRKKKVITNKWENNNILKLQQSQPIPVVVNKYAILDSLQEESEAFQTHSRASQVALSRNKKKCPPNVTKRKTVIIGDSHATGIAAEISSALGKDFEVTGTVTPGARLENITNLADKEVSTIGKSDTVIVMGGANEVSKKEANIGLKHLGKFVNSRQNTNIMTVTALHRNDLQETSCVNMEMEVFNRKLHKAVKTADNVNIIQANLSRNDFTHHGLHLNISGKEKMAELIWKNIKKLMARKEETPIILKWEKIKRILLRKKVRKN
jgi:lysophospholipase L1-like esterase